jgi:putative ABC transport system ATP-binding protein
MEIILNLNREKKMTTIIVTHDPNIAAQTGRVLHLRDGALEAVS